jgi:hypothetical protein
MITRTSRERLRASALAPQSTKATGKMRQRFLNLMVFGWEEFYTAFLYYMPFLPPIMANQNKRKK